jgi:cysteine desulfurase / selenocysteine lyase
MKSADGDVARDTGASMIDASSEFPIAQRAAYLNTAAQGPWPARTVVAMHANAQKSQFLDGEPAGESRVFADTRQQLARLLNASQQDFVFGPNTSYGLNVCTHGIDWRAGDNLVVPFNEFPSVQYALAHLPALGVEVRSVPWQGSGPTVDQLMARVDARTRAVICSAIAWDTGYRIDLEALGARCAAAGCLSIVDGIHAVGAEPLDLAALRISAVSFHGYKWLMAGFGCGVLYVSPQAIDQIRPTFVGPRGIAGSVMGTQAEIEWLPGAQRYATGTGNQTSAWALNASLSLIEEIGLPDIAAHNHGVANAIDAGIRRQLPDAHVWRSAELTHQSAIVVFTTADAKRDAALVQQLAANGVIVALRPAGIRVAPHLFNTQNDVNRLLAGLQKAP